MVESFPKTLAYLRKEKKISQKEAAAALGVSQALLSHYENGLREPGLEFAVRAAEYYGVSTDYLLGVTADKEGRLISVSELPDAGRGRRRDSQNNTPFAMQRRISLNGVGFLYDMLAKTGSPSLLEEAASYLDLAVYKLIRHLTFGDENRNGFFLLPPEEYEPLCDAEIKRTEGNIKRILREKGGKEEKIMKLPPLDHDLLREEYPAYEQSVLALLHALGGRLDKLRKL